MAGYFQYSKSNNALAAERAGIYPASIAVKKYGFKSVTDLKCLVKSSEWHHSSKFYNRVDYYDVKDAIQNIDNIKKINNWLPRMNKRGKHFVLEQAKNIIKENLEIKFIFEKIKLRTAAGYYKDRKRNIKR